MNSNDTMPPDRRVPSGFRQGLITAITVFLGFSLAFLHYWAFEAPGEWTWRSIVVTGAMAVAIGLEVYSLFRALRLADDTPEEYGRTVRWFIASAILLLAGLLLAAIIISRPP